MSDSVAQRRTQAWASLVRTVGAKEPAMNDVTLFVKSRPGLLRAVQDTGSSATRARRSLTDARSRLTISNDDATIASAEAWVGCLDDILRLTERLCREVAPAA